MSVRATTLRLQEHADVSALGTLGTPAGARFLAEVSSAEDLRDAWAFARARSLPAVVLGGGSNVVLPNRFDGVLLHLRLRGVRVLADNDNRVLLEIGAGENWHELVRRSLGLGLAGVESMALIPGTVGAAPVQNIGAYGGELAQVFESADVLLDTAERTTTFTRTDCEFAYRDSRFKRLGDSAVILSVRLVLQRARAPTASYPEVARELLAMGCATPSSTAYAEAVIRVRRRKLPDPRHHGNVGSFFHNPLLTESEADAVFARDESLRLLARPETTPAGPRVKIPAAALIERCGWRGRCDGPVEAWRRQPLVLVNRGGATREDVLATAARIQGDVERRFGVVLRTEPRTQFP